MEENKNLVIESEITENQDTTVSQEVETNSQGKPNDEVFILDDFIVADGEKETEEANSSEKETALETPQNEPKAVSESSNTNSVTFNSRMIGIASREVKNQKKTPTLAEETLALLAKIKENKEILWAKISGVEYNLDAEGNRTMIGITCVWDDGEGHKVTITIPDQLYFIDDTNFGKDYDKKEPKDQVAIRHRIASFQIGATVCFTILNSFKDKNDNVFAIGNRLEALKTLQDIFFIHENYRATLENTLVVGSQVRANVLSVRPHDVFVECCGVETHIDNFSIANSPVENCRDVVKTGDIITARIRKIYTEPKPYLSLTCRTGNTKSFFEKAQVGSVSVGKLVAINKEKAAYTFRLENGLDVVVYEGNNMTTRAKLLVRGDRAIVQIVKKKPEKNKLIGKIVQKI